MEKPEINVEVERLDSIMIDEHLRNCSVVLHDIFKDTKDHEDWSMEPDNGHVCQHCGKIYKTLSTLHSHNLLRHPQNEIEGQCVTCEKKYPSLLSLQKHIRYMHRYEHRCNACYRAFATPELLSIHGEGCSKSKTPCTECNKVFDSPLALRNHMKYKHPDKSNYWCELCRRTFTTHRRLINHTASIHPPGATDCTWCGKTFNSITSLQSHILYRHSDGGAKCVQCHKVFAKKSSLQRHLAKNHYFSAANKDVVKSATSNIKKY